MGRRVRRSWRARRWRRSAAGDLSLAAAVRSDETDRLVDHDGAISMTDVREFDAAYHLDNPAVIAAYLTEAFATGDNHLARLKTGDEFDALTRRGPPVAPIPPPADVARDQTEISPAANGGCSRRAAGKPVERGLLVGCLCPPQPETVHGRRPGGGPGYCRCTRSLLDWRARETTEAKILTLRGKFLPWESLQPVDNDSAPNEMEGRMGRRPIGSRAMTGIERKHRHAAKLAGELARLKDLASASGLTHCLPPRAVSPSISIICACGRTGLPHGCVSGLAALPPWRSTTHSARPSRMPQRRPMSQPDRRQNSGAGGYGPASSGPVGPVGPQSSLT